MTTRYADVSRSSPRPQRNLRPRVTSTVVRTAACLAAVCALGVEPTAPPVYNRSLTPEARQVTTEERVQTPSADVSRPGDAPQAPITLPTPAESDRGTARPSTSGNAQGAHIDLGQLARMTQGLDGDE